MLRQLTPRINDANEDEYTNDEYKTQQQQIEDENNYFTTEGKVYIQNLTNDIINNYNKYKTSYLIEDHIDYSVLADTEIKYGIENSLYTQSELEIIKRNNSADKKQLFKKLRNLRLKK